MAIKRLGAQRFSGLAADVNNLPIDADLIGAIFNSTDTLMFWILDDSQSWELQAAGSGGITQAGQSTDVKPAGSAIGDQFVENDTGRVFVWDGVEWNYNRITDEASNFNALDSRSSVIQLFGDTFSTTAASSVFLLEDLTDEQGGTSLTNNGTITFSEQQDLPFRGYLAPTLNGTDQYFSIPTETKVEVGTGSFVASIWFKTSNTADNKVIFTYGDVTTGEQNWGVSLPSGGTGITAVIDDGTNTGVAAATNGALFYRDDKWHIVTMIVDRDPTVNLMTLYVDGELLATDDISDVTLTLDNAGTNMDLGVRTNATVPERFFEGQYSNFSLYLAADYNIPSLLQAELRESASQGNLVVAASTIKRLNNHIFNNDNTDGDYSTTVINTSEGIYDILVLTNSQNTAGIMKIDIDGENVFTQDLYDDPAVQNLQFKAEGIFLSAGTHILKVKVDGRNVSGLGFFYTFSLIELIKRDGNNEGDDEATSGALFGDELDRRNTLWNFDVENLNFYNQAVLQDSPALGDFIEGDVFLKKGLYNITYTYQTGGASAKADLFFGGVKVIDALDQSLTSLRNQQETISVFLGGGKTTVRLEVNSAGAGAGGFFLTFESIRFELVTGKGNGDTVNILAPDGDFQVASGTMAIVADADDRLNARVENSSLTLGDSVIYNRYFSGGTYQVDWVFFATTNRGTVDLGFGGVDDNIFSDLDQFNGSNDFNKKAFTTVTIPRGMQKIKVTSTSSGFSINLLQFTKIATVETTEDDNSDPVHGALIPLANYTAPRLASSVTFDFGGLDSDKYSSFIVEIQGKANASLELQAQINNRLTASYSQYGYRTLTGGLTNYWQTGNLHWQLATTAVITGAFEFSAHLEIKRANTTDVFHGTFWGTAAGVGSENGNVALSDLQNFLSQLIIKTSLSSWQPATTIQVYGVKI